MGSWVSLAADDAAHVDEYRIDVLGMRICLEESLQLGGIGDRNVGHGFPQIQSGEGTTATTRSASFTPRCPGRRLQVLRRHCSWS